MKKIIVAIIAIMLTSSLFASDVKATKAEKKLASDMRVMLDSIVDMQKAGFYDDVRVIKKATDRLIVSLDSLLAVDPASYLPKEQKHAGKFAKKREKMIRMYANDLLESLEAKQYDDVIENYNQIIRQCYSCHLRIRRR
ncbi:MAG: hypothetical protein Q9M32_04775 [Sulfurimonas sp.]|nr:hypothetical protein [Sulfurimonas sp.]MDQ7060145.1 hypothetical protein [Sulfurimonas sp.]